MGVSQNIAVIGLGSMGFGIASNALKAGHSVWGYDINPAQTEKFRAIGGGTDALGDIADKLDTIISVVLNAAQTEDVLFGDSGIVPQLKPGTVILSCATVSPEFARKMEARSAEHGVLYLDAPVSGGVVGATSGNLTIMASGQPDAFARARPAMEAISGRVFELGDAAGAGSAMKATNQLLAGVHIASMAEALTFGMTQGIKPETFLEIISTSAGTSWMLEDRTPHIVDGDYAPRSMINIWPKDLGIVAEIAEAAGFEAPITQTALAQYAKAVDMGLGYEDDAALAKVYARQVGIKLPGDADT